MAEAMEAVDKELQKSNEEDEDIYVWDENSQLYFHHSSGFYHDPNAGWYYSSKDGIYYKYENGEYTPSDLDETHGNSSLDESHRNISSGPVDSCLLFREDEGKVQNRTIGPGEISSGYPNDKEHNDPPRPSAWVEETLIDLYLAGYNQQPNQSSDAMVYSGVDQNYHKLSTHGDDDSEELEEGEWIPEEDFDPHFPMEEEFDEGAIPVVHSTEEEIWKAQYGQVVDIPEKALPEIPAVDLWDWKMVSESSKDGNGQVARLVGRLVRQSAKLHPSVASGGKLLKTAPICEVQLHLVRVRTGQVYKLRNPSAEHLASLSVYDSSNPTKDWRFPEISNTWQSSDPKRKAKKKTKGNTGFRGSAKSHDPLNMAEEHRSHTYRDRAAERRNLHGGYGVGPGQKTSSAVDCNDSELPETASAEEAAAEALDMSFGSQSYARRIMGNMGWKEGETLGRTMKGLLEPIHAAGNAGNAGLGYPVRRANQS